MGSLKIDQERRAADDRRRHGDRRHPDPDRVRHPGTMDRRTGWQRRHADRRGNGPLPPPPDISAT
jgi:hypothetical protein